MGPMGGVPPHGALGALCGPMLRCGKAPPVQFTFVDLEGADLWTGIQVWAVLWRLDVGLRRLLSDVFDMCRKSPIVLPVVSLFHTLCQHVSRAL